MVITVDANAPHDFRGDSSGIRWGGIAALMRWAVARTRASILVYHDPSPSVLERHAQVPVEALQLVKVSDVVDAIKRDR